MKAVTCNVSEVVSKMISDSSGQIVTRYSQVPSQVKSHHANDSGEVEPPKSVTRVITTFVGRFSLCIKSNIIITNTANSPSSTVIKYYPRLIKIVIVT